jgi:hypothetical protein
MSKLYIAFGSNLSKKQMRFRCPTARPLGKFVMKDARLVFRNVADLEFIPGAKTPCGLWSINHEDEKALDRYEGISSGAYFKSEAIQLSYCGRKRPALIYLMNSQAIYPPSQAYVDTIRRGYRDFEMDEKFLNDAIARSFIDKDADDEEMMARRERQLDTRIHSQLVEMPESVVKMREEAKGESC